MNMLFKLAWRNIKANKRHNVPYVLSTSLMFSFFYVCYSLVFNEYVQSRNPSLADMITASSVALLITVFAFSVYNNFTIQKYRQKEYAIYSVLGLAKHHIRVLILIEQFFYYILIAPLSLIMGQLIGSLMFLFLNKLLHVNSAGLSEYNFAPKAALYTVAFALLASLVSTLIQIIKVTKLSPKELFQSQDKAEKLPRVKWVSLVLGLICIATSYFLALSSDDFYKAATVVFIAVFLAVIGTYLTFASICMLVLKQLKKQKKYYYKPENFISVSGMSYRINSSSSSLANVVVFSTGVIMAMGCCYYLNWGMEDNIRYVAPTDYEIQLQLVTDMDNSRAEKSLENIYTQVAQIVNPVDMSMTQMVIIPVYLKGNSLQAIGGETDKGDLDKQIRNVQFIKQSDFNKLPGEKVSLAADEVALEVYDGSQKKITELEILDHKYKSKALQDRHLSSQDINTGVFVVVPDDLDIQKLASKLLQSYAEDANLNFVFSCLNFNVKDEQEKEKLDLVLGDLVSDNLAFSAEDENFSVVSTSKSDAARALYELNAGLLFIAILLSTILLVGTALIMYYKQVSEAYADSKNYVIMKRVGLTSALIKKSNSKQLFWLFFLPLLGACIHCIVAAKIMYQLFEALAIKNLAMFLLCFIGSALLYFAVYALFYLWTNRVYFDIVDTADIRNS